MRQTKRALKTRLPRRAGRSTALFRPAFSASAGFDSVALSAAALVAAHMSFQPGRSGRITECKLVLLGDSNVGKSSLVLRFVKNQFNADQVTTVGAAFLQSPVPLDDSEDKIQFGIWDTAGSERYKALAPMYYRGAEAAIVVYDITSFESFEGAKAWVRELKLYGQPNVVVALAANKCDLEQYRAVSTQEGQAYARENELTYFETSAKSSHNVRRMFVELAQRVPRKDASAMRESTSLNNGQTVVQGPGCIC